MEHGFENNYLYASLRIRAFFHNDISTDKEIVLPTFRTERLNPKK